MQIINNIFENEIELILWKNIYNMWFSPNSAQNKKNMTSGFMIDNMFIFMVYVDRWYS